MAVVSLVAKRKHDINGVMTTRCSLRFEVRRCVSPSGNVGLQHCSAQFHLFSLMFWTSFRMQSGINSKLFLWQPPSGSYHLPDCQMVHDGAKDLELLPLFCWFVHFIFLLFSCSYPPSELTLFKNSLKVDDPSFLDTEVPNLMVLVSVSELLSSLLFFFTCSTVPVIANPFCCVRVCAHVCVRVRKFVERETNSFVLKVKIWF